MDHTNLSREATFYGLSGCWSNINSGTLNLLLFVDPTTGSSLADLDADASYTFGSDWDNIGNVQASHVGTSGNTGSMAFDEIRIGTEAADMFSAIPEPSILTLIGLGGMALLLRRRRA